MDYSSECQFILALLLYSCTSSMATESVPLGAAHDALPVKPFQSEDHRIRNCGGLTYETSKIFNINYQSGTQLRMSEFCVWVLQPASNNRAIAISYYSNIPTDSADGVYVYTWSTLGLTAYDLPKDETVLTVKARLVLIAFSKYSDDTSHGNGLEIRVEGTLTLGKINTHFVDKFQGEIKYPQILGEATYDNNDYFALVIQTQKGQHPPDVLQNKYFQLVDVDTEKGKDVIEIYELYPYSFEGSAIQPRTAFKKLASVSGTHKGVVREATTLTPWPYIVLFKSDKKITGTGFTVRWKNLE